LIPGSEREATCATYLLQPGWPAFAAAAAGAFFFLLTKQLPTSSEATTIYTAPRDIENRSADDEENGVASGCCVARVHRSGA
jgi:hypothetical protein